MGLSDATETIWERFRIGERLSCIILLRLQIQDLSRTAIYMIFIVLLY